VIKALEVIDEFSVESSLSLNKEKCKVIKIGEIEDDLIIEKDIEIINETKILGSYIGIDEKNTKKLTLEEIKTKIIQKTSNWNKFKLSLYGKKIIIQQQLTSYLVYIFRSRYFTKTELKEIEAIIFQFIWKNNSRKPIEKIARKTLINDEINGGLGLTLPFIFQNALILSWLPRIINCDLTPWGEFCNHILDNIGGIKFLLYYEYKVSCLCTKFKIPEYLGKILELYLIIREEQYSLFDQIIWNNKIITCNNKSFYIQEYINNNIIFIRDLLDTNKKFFTWNQFSRFNFSNIKEYNKIRRALLKLDKSN
jgi:hypothetical protein